MTVMTLMPLTTSRILSLVAVVSLLGAALVAGVFFAFSTFVMPALGRLPSSQGLAAMQSINVAAVNRWLMGALFGTAAACVVLLVASPWSWSAVSHDPIARLRVAASLVYLVGAIGVTIACNVPLNEALAAVPAAEGAAAWDSFASRWTAWNHVRGVASFGAAALLALSLLPRVAGDAWLPIATLRRDRQHCRAHPGVANPANAVLSGGSCPSTRP